MGEMCYRCKRPTMRSGRCSACGYVSISHSAADAQSILRPGTTLDNGSIKIGESLGHGGLGITYLARDSQYGVIALKEFFPRKFAFRKGNSVVPLPSHEHDYQNHLHDFRREVKHLLNLKDHPNIVNVLFDLEENNTFYYGMELLKGETLEAYIQRHPLFSPAKAFALLEPIIDALAFAHKEKTLHRDIAPNNIFMRLNQANPEHPSPCLIDFGSAYTAKSNFTQEAPRVKKRGYSPYEQLSGVNQQGPYTDIYALTATLYYMLTKTSPVSSENRVHKQELLMPASHYNSAVSSRLNHVIETGMAINPPDRYQTMEDLRAALLDAIPRSADSTSSASSVPAQKKASLVCQRGLIAGQAFPLSGDQIIGREGTLRIPQEDRRASRRHCRIFTQNGMWYLTDLNSHNGTIVNGVKQPPGAAVVLRAGAKILVGAEEFIFQIIP